MKANEITVRLTKQMEKDLGDLERCAAGCEHARDRKTLERVAKNLRKALGRPARAAQSGGMAPIDPAIYNFSNLLNTDASPIDAGAAGAGLVNIPAPFHDGNAMGAGALFSEQTGASFIPSAYHPTLPAQAGGAKKHSKSKTKSKKHA